MKYARGGSTHRWSSVISRQRVKLEKWAPGLDQGLPGSPSWDFEPRKNEIVLPRVAPRNPHIDWSYAAGSS